MFERFTQEARRSIFFARADAGRFGSPSIEPEHLLLALVRKNSSLRGFSSGISEQIRKRIEDQAPPSATPVPDRLDMQVSDTLRRVFTYAAQESDALHADTIDCSHLMLGLLHLETSAVAEMLRDFGIDYATYREMIAAPAESGTAPKGEPLPVHGSVARAVSDLTALLIAVSDLKENPGQRLKRAGWTRKEALGHLIDWAAAHQQWFARALTEPKIAATGCPDETWLAAQHYNDLEWQQLVELAASVNVLIVHVLAHIPEDKLETPCRIGIAGALPLRELAVRYVAHCHDIVGQLRMRG